MKTSRGCLGWGFHILAWILAVAFVLLMPVALTGRSVGAVLFSPERMGAIVQNRLIDSGTLDRALADAIFRGGMGGDGSTFGRVAEFLSEAERQELMGSVLPPGWVGAQLLESLRGFYAWLDGEEAYPSLILEIGPVKDRLLGGGLVAIVDTVVDSWPSCTPEEAEQLRTELLRTGEPSHLCEPPEPIRGQIVEWITLTLEEETRSLPDRIPMVERVPGQAAQLVGMKQDLRMARAWMRWGWLVPVSLLGWIMAFVIRNKRAWARWWGIPLTLAGLGTMALGLLLQAGRSGLVGSLGADWTVANVQILRPILLGTVGQVLVRTLFQGFLLAIVGGVLWWYSRRGSAAMHEAQARESAVAETERVEEPAAVGAPPPVALIDDEREEPPDPPPSGIFDHS